ncbi:hypothetical protein GGR54DRAFT_651357 [Hypoxylon sp. NC1633]|nr:hypothetical protein GGR54DRAFT_651357 [Hypoxylon sp. NC1633]
MDQVSRIHLLVWQLRGRISKFASLQNRIPLDIAMFARGDEAASEQFEAIRTGYLGTLQISVKELREAMNSSELAIPSEDFVVEKVFKRVKPLTMSYLDQLVQEGVIDTDDKDCIVMGAYRTVEDYIEDFSKPVDPFGLFANMSPPPDYVAAARNTNEPQSYDDDGFLIVRSESDKEDAKNGADNTDKTPPKSISAEEPNPQPSLPIALAKDQLSPTKVYSWAKDVDGELEEVSRSPNDSSSAPSSPQSGEEISDVVSISSDSSDDSSLMFDLEIDDEDSGKVSAEREERAKKKVQSAKVGPRNVLEPWLAIDWDELYDSLGIANTSSKPDDSDKILNRWLVKQNMWYWQWEIIFAAMLTAKRMKQHFLDARGFYKADPYYDRD